MIYGLWYYYRLCVGGGGGGGVGILEWINCGVIYALRDGALNGGPQCRMSILRNGNVACLCRLFPTILGKGNDNITTHYIVTLMSHITKSIPPPLHMCLSPMSHVEFKKCPCHPVGLRGQWP